MWCRRSPDEGFKIACRHSAHDESATEILLAMAQISGVVVFHVPDIDPVKAMKRVPMKFAQC